jgi:multiple sugar transport system permease protein
MTQTAAPPKPAGLTREERRRLSEGARAERRFGWLLCAPAVIVMALVAFYPIGYAIYLSLQRYDLRFPQFTSFVGLSNYGVVLSSGVWWHAFAVTVIITVVSVAVELVLGMALAMLLHRTPLWRGLVRTSILLPYGIVTVAAAFSWQFAWTPGVGYLANLLPAGSAPLTSQFQAIAVIILEDRTIHDPAPAGRPLPRPGRAAAGGQGRRGQRVAAVHPDHAAADEAGDPGGAAVPDP